MKFVVVIIITVCLCCLLQHSFKTQRVMLGSIRADLRAVKTDAPDFETTRFMRQDQQLLENVVQLGQETDSKICDSIVIGVRVSSDKKKRNRFARCRFEPWREARMPVA
jgi:hypothetical protein